MSVIQADRSALNVTDLRGSQRRNRTEWFVKGTLRAAAGVSVVISISIVAVLVVRSMGFLGEVKWSTLLDPAGWFPRSGKFDLVTLFMGSIWVTMIALVVATPLGIASAVFLAEYASPRQRRIMKPLIEVLAGMPSVVIAFFVLQVLQPSLLSGFVERFSLLGAGIGVGVLTIPIIATVTEDALASVPLALREASYGLGARKVTTTVRVVLPAALSGITAAVIVGASRALGETMLVTLVAGGAGGANRAWLPTDAGLTMTSAMANLAVGSDNVAASGGTALNPVDSLYLVGLLLFVFTFGLNMLGDRIVRRFQQKY